jgi:hypothetical protein
VKLSVRTSEPILAMITSSPETASSTQFAPRGSTLDPEDRERHNDVMSLWYRVLYQIGLTPWEGDATSGPLAEQVSALFDREEHSRRSGRRSISAAGPASGP